MRLKNKTDEEIKLLTLKFLQDNGDYISEADKSFLELANLFSEKKRKKRMSQLKGGFKKISDIEYLKRYFFIVKKLAEGKTIREIAAYYNELRDPKLKKITNNAPCSSTPSYSTIGKVSRIYNKQLNTNPYFDLNELASE